MTYEAHAFFEHWKLNVHSEITKKKLPEKGYGLLDNLIYIGTGKILSITTRILVVGSQRVNKQS